MSGIKSTNLLRSRIPRYLKRNRRLGPVGSLPLEATDVLRRRDAPSIALVITEERVPIDLLTQRVRHIKNNY